MQFLWQTRSDNASIAQLDGYVDGSHVVQLPNNFDGFKLPYIGFEFAQNSSIITLFQNVPNNSFRYYWNWDVCPDTHKNDNVGGNHIILIFKYDDYYNFILIYAPAGVFIGNYDINTSTIHWNDLFTQSGNTLTINY